MKFWIAESVLTDYTDGMICIYAKNETEAIEKLYEKDSTAFFTMYYNINEECKCVYKGDRSVHIWNHHKPKKLPDVFKKVNESEAFTVWGGG